MKKIWLFLLVLILSMPIVKAETLEGEEKKFYHVKFTFTNGDSPIDSLNLTVFKTFTEHLNTFTWASDEFSGSDGIIDIVLEEGRYQFIQSTMVDDFPEFFSWKGDVRQDLEFIVDFSKPVSSLQPIVKDEPIDDKQDNEENNEPKDPIDEANNPNEEDTKDQVDENPKQDETNPGEDDKQDENPKQEEVNNPSENEPNKDDANDKEEVNNLATEDDKTNITFEDTLTFNYSWLLLLGAFVIGIFKK